MEYNFCDYKEMNEDEVERYLRKIAVLCFKVTKNSIDLSTDKVYFGCAIKYIFWGQDGIDGQGDVNEGLIARFKDGNSRIEKYKDKFGDDLIITKKNGFFELRRRSSLTVSLACFFSKCSKDEIVLPEKDEKEFFFEYEISIEIFKSFTNKEIVNIKDFKMINYHNKENIYKKVVDSLKKENINEKDIILSDVKYIKRNVNEEWECEEYLNNDLSVDIPYELFYKDIQFHYQNESRIMLNDHKCSKNRENNFSYCEKNKQFISKKEFENYIVEVRDCDIYEQRLDDFNLYGSYIKFKIPMRIKPLNS